MNGLALLTKLERLGVHLWCEGKHLCFDAPGGALTEELLGHMRAQKEAVRREIRSRSTAPVSAAQRRLWIFQTFAPESPTLNVALPVRMRGPLDVNALAGSLRVLVDRHEALRTSFEESSRGLLQRVSQRSNCDISRVSLCIEEDLEQVLRQQIEQPFVMSAPPLLRASLLRLSENDHVLSLVLHHLICDYWSTGILLTELCELYPCIVGGRQPALAPLPIRSLDYAAFQAAENSADQTVRLSYWKELLHGIAPLELPSTSRRTARLTYRGGVIPIRLDASTIAAIKALARDERATLFTAMLSAFALLLAGWSGQRRFVVGTDHANRDAAAVEGMVGMLADQLPILCDVSGRVSFRDTVRRMRDRVRESLAHRVPFQSLINTLDGPGEAGRRPIFDVTFIVQETSMLRAHLPGIELSFLSAPVETAQYDLAVTCEHWPDGGIASFRYGADVFHRDVVERMAKSYVSLLDFFAAHPEQQTWSRGLLDPNERKVVVSQWNQTKRGYDFASFEDAFEQQVDLHPNDLAAICGADSLTYSELASRARSVAAALCRSGVVAETRVALYGRRNLDYLTGMVATLYTGAFVPLDPRHPVDRNRDLIERAGCSVVLAGETCPAELTTGTRVIEISQALNFPAEPFPPTISQRRLAYILFTSGSTGRPKGAMIEHRGMWNHLLAKIEDLGLTRFDIVAQTAPQNFDISIWQFLAALAVGARIHIVHDECAMDAALLLEEVDHCGITVLQAVPSLLSYFSDEASRT
jgi:non-ribosomal peptide synthetase component F